MKLVSDSKRNQLKGYGFALQRLSSPHCLEPLEQCALPAIRAHSIQNAVVLDQLCADGHVIMPAHRASNFDRYGASFTSVGRNRATTFTGLCGVHDAMIFAPIDRTPIDVRNQEHLFLLAYRSVLREMHASITAAMKISSIVEKKEGLGLARGVVLKRDRLRASHHINNAFEYYLYKREYDAAFSLRKFGRIQHVRFFEPNRSPSIAVSALFSLDNIVLGDDVARVALNVFPAADGVMIIFSFLREHATQIRTFMRPFRESSGDRLLEMVSVRVLNSCENFVIAPRFWYAMAESDRVSIQDFFAETLFSDGNDLDKRHFMLFTPSGH